MHDYLPVFHSAQTQARLLLQDSFRQLEIGMKSTDIVESIKAQASSFGFSSWLRPPRVTLSQSSLQAGTMISIYLQPATAEAFANVGSTQTFQQPNHPIIDLAEELCRAICTYASHTKCVGELFVFARSWANNNRAELGSVQHIGHQCFPPSDRSKALWPTSMRVKSWLRRHQIQWYNPRLIGGIYAIHPILRKQGQQASFAEMIAVDGEKRMLLGREDMSDFTQIGT